MKTSKKGIELIKQFEGCKLTAYKVYAGERYYTIGFGHYGKDVKSGMTITPIEAERLLKVDLKRFEDNVNKYDSIYHFNQNEFDALVSFAYNLGSIDNLTLNGKRSKEVIAEKMLLYFNSCGHVVQGLVNRRKAEHDLFMTPIDDDTKDIVLLTESDTLKDVVDLIYRGEFGNNEKRKEKLYNSIQRLVNLRK